MPQLLQRGPSELLAYLRYWLADHTGAQKMQFDRSLRVHVCRTQQLFADLSANTQFLTKLAGETSVERFAFFALSSREFPVALEMHACLASADEESGAIFDDRGTDDDDLSHEASGLNGNVRQLADIGQTRHFGRLATQTMAPRSIKAWLKSKTFRVGTSAADTAHRCCFTE